MYTPHSEFCVLPTWCENFPPTVLSVLIQSLCYHRHRHHNYRHRHHHNHCPHHHHRHIYRHYFSLSRFLFPICSLCWFCKSVVCLPFALFCFSQHVPHFHIQSNFYQQKKSYSAECSLAFSHTSTVPPSINSISPCWGDPGIWLSWKPPRGGPAGTANWERTQSSQEGLYMYPIWPECSGIPLEEVGKCCWGDGRLEHPA